MYDTRSVELFFCSAVLNANLVIDNIAYCGYDYDSTSIRRPFECLSKFIKVTVAADPQSHWPVYLVTPTCSSPHKQGRIQGDRGVHAPPPVVSVCHIFGAWLLAFRHSTQLTSKRLSTELLKVSELPHLSLTLTLAQPCCNCKCNLTLTLDSR